MGEWRLEHLGHPKNQGILEASCQGIQGECRSASQEEGKCRWEEEEMWRSCQEIHPGTQGGCRCLLESHRLEGKGVCHS